MIPTKFWWQPCLLTNRDEMNNLHRGHSIDVSYQVSVQAVSKEKIKKNQPIRNKNCLWRPYLLTDQEKMCNLQRGPPIDASYQVSVHLAKRFRRRLKKNWPIRNKNCLWRPCLLIYRDKMSILFREPSIDTSYQVSVHLAERFQRRRLKCEKLTDDRRQTPSDGKSSHCLWQGELKMHK